MSNQTIELIRISGKASSREEAIAEAAVMLIEANAVHPEYLDSMLARESSVSTFMGNLLAIPHGTLEGANLVKTSALAVIRYDAPLDWDGEEVRFVIGIAGKDGTHMDSLAMIAQVFTEMDSVESLLEAENEAQFSEIFALKRVA